MQFGIAFLGEQLSALLFRNEVLELEILFNQRKELPFLCRLSTIITLKNESYGEDLL